MSLNRYLNDKRKAANPEAPTVGKAVEEHSLRRLLFTIATPGWQQESPEPAVTFCPAAHQVNLACAYMAENTFFFTVIIFMLKSLNAWYFFSTVIWYLLEPIWLLIITFEDTNWMWMVLRMLYNQYKECLIHLTMKSHRLTCVWLLRVRLWSKPDLLPSL